MTSKGNIMVLDSDADVTLLLEEVLMSEGYSVYRCDGAATADSIARRQPDALILELSPLFPDATILLLNALRRHPITRDMAVLVISTDARTLSLLAEPLGLFGCATLTKPFDLDAIISGVGRLVAVRAPRGPRFRC
jgi:two-component system response regulator (stage 0 sporulation protein F)